MLDPLRAVHALQALAQHAVRCMCCSKYRCKWVHAVLGLPLRPCVASIFAQLTHAPTTTHTVAAPDVKAVHCLPRLQLDTADDCIQACGGVW